MRRRFDVRDYTVFYVGQNGQIILWQSVGMNGFEKRS